MKNPCRLFLLSVVFVCVIFSCSKKSDVVPTTKDDVSIASFRIDTIKSPLFKEPFVGKVSGYADVSLIHSVNAPSIINLNVSTNPASYKNNVSYAVKNDDGSMASTSSFSINGSQISFTVPGTYRLSCIVAAGANNNSSAASSELKLQVASNIPDNNLRAVLKTRGLSFSGEILDTTSVSALHALYIDNQMLESLAGINYLNNLDTLYCNHNNLTSLNLQGMSNLKFVECGSNQLTSINVNGMTNLHYLLCSHNSLSVIDLKGLTNLLGLDCSDNNLHDLDVQGLVKLLSLRFNNNQLSAINLTGLSQLVDLDCSVNNVSTLSVQEFPKLQYLLCSYTNITKLDVQNLSGLKALSFYSNAPLDTLTLSTLPASYPYMQDLRVSVASQCSPGIKQIKKDRGSALFIRTFNAGNLADMNFDAVAACP